MQSLKEQSLIDSAERAIRKKKTPLDLYELFNIVCAEKGYSNEQKSESITQFYTDLITSAKFVYTGDNTWDLKEFQKTDLREKDGSYYKEYTVIDDTDEEKEAKAKKKAKPKVKKKVKRKAKKKVKPIVEEIKVEEIKVEEVKVEEIKVEEIKVEEIKVEEIKVEEIVEIKTKVTAADKKAKDKDAVVEYEEDTFEELEDEFDEDKYNEYMDTYENKYDEK